MNVRYRVWITRKTVQAHPDTIFLFGDNWLRRGLGGQAKAMRGEPNAIGIRTKKRPSNDPNAFLSDEDYDVATKLIKEDFDSIPASAKEVIVPGAGLGTGLADLPNRAPRIASFIDEQIELLKRR